MVVVIRADCGWGSRERGDYLPADMEAVS
jgi:hypothetical protein